MSELPVLRQLCESYCDLRWHLDPVEGSGAGLPAYDERLGSFTDDRVREYLAALQSLSGAVEALDLETLDDEIDRTALLNHVRVAEHRWRHEQPHRRDPGLWVQQVLDGLYQLLLARDRDSRTRTASACARLEAVPHVLADAQATLRDCPRALLEGARDAVVLGPGLVRELVASCTRDGIENPDHAATVAASAEAAMAGFGAHLAGMLRTAGPEVPVGVGRDALGFRLQHQHTVRDSTEQLLRYASVLVAEIERELAAAARELGAERWPDLVARLRAEQTPADALVATFRDAVEQTRNHVERHDLAAVPAGDLQVLETPRFARAWVPVAGYLPPGPQATDRVGRLFVTVPEPGTGVAGHGRHAIPATTAHEVFPGHHLQFLAAHAQDRFVRRCIAAPVALEGWALYAESLMLETGFYRTPEERLLQLHALLWRAVRIPVDVGIHTGSLAYDDAVRLFMQRVQASRAHAEAEVRRTCAQPGYGLAYAVGRRELLALRSAYRARVGAAYTHRAFHDTVLSYGGLAPSLVRWGMERDA
jgi:uncharacterized protein (DUF885 family)